MMHSVLHHHLITSNADYTRLLTFLALYLGQPPPMTRVDSTPPPNPVTEERPPIHPPHHRNRPPATLGDTVQNSPDRTPVSPTACMLTRPLSPTTHLDPETSCSHCQRGVEHTCSIICAECDNMTLCITCFSNGAEVYFVQAELCFVQTKIGVAFVPSQCR